MKKTVSATRSNSSIPGNGRPRAAASAAAGSPSLVAGAILRIFNPSPAFSSRTGGQDVRTLDKRRPDFREPQDAVASLFRNHSGPHDALRPRPAARLRRPREDGKTSGPSRHVGARLLRVDGRLAAAYDRAADGGRPALG